MQIKPSVYSTHAQHILSYFICYRVVPQITTLMQVMSGKTAHKKYLDHTNWLCKYLLQEGMNFDKCVQEFCEQLMHEDMCGISIKCRDGADKEISSPNGKGSVVVVLQAPSSTFPQCLQTQAMAN